MKKILCPTDFSPAAQNAIAYAAKFCQVADAEMTLFNVQSVFDFLPADALQGRMTRLQSVAQLLEQQSEEVGAVFKIVSHSEVHPTVSPLSHVIEKKSAGYDLVIMSGGRPRDLYSFFAGSTAYNAMRRSNIPVLLIPENYLFSPVDTMIYAYNVLVERRLPLLQLRPWLERLKSNLSVLEVLEDAISMDIEDEMNDIRELLELRYDDIPIHLESVHAAAKSEGIHRYMIEKKGDILVLCSRHRSFIASLFHKSTIESIYANACYPVFVVHE